MKFYSNEKQWQIQGFFLKPPLSRVFKGEGSTFIFGFQSGVPLSKSVIFTLFWQNFLKKGGGGGCLTPLPLDPPIKNMSNGVDKNLAPMS
jgi:hypothetical protein